MNKLLFFLSLLPFVMCDNAQGWDITKLPPDERQNLCDNQVMFCRNNCGGPDKAPKAFCNTDTMGWGCGCLTYTPTISPWGWPIAVRDCVGNQQQCVANCGSKDSGVNECYANCKIVWACNTQEAPVSYLEVDTISDKPAYSGFAITYSGHVPGTNITTTAPTPAPTSASATAATTSKSDSGSNTSTPSSAQSLVCTATLSLTLMFLSVLLS